MVGAENAIDEATDTAVLSGSGVGAVGARPCDETLFVPASCAITVWPFGLAFFLPCD